MSPYKLRDTLDICAFRRISPQISPKLEPTTPIKRKSPARKLDPFEDTSIDSGTKSDSHLSSQSPFHSSPRSKNAHNTSDINAHDSDSKSSAYFSGRSSQNSFVNQSQAEDDSDSFNIAYLLSESSINCSEYSVDDSMQQLKDTLEICGYRQKIPEIIVSLETTAGSVVQEPDSIVRPVTSSPLSPTNRRKFNDVVEIIEDPKNFNDSLEFVNYRLAVCGYVPMSPSKMAKRKRLMKNYVADLLKQESIQRDEAKKAKKQASLKRTISVDHTMKLLL